MSKGQKKSIYIPEDSVRFYEDLVKDEKSDSNIITQAIYKQAIAKYANVNISEGAYVALAEGRFDMLNHLKLENGSVMITLKEDAYRLHGGIRGELADAKDALDEYLGRKRG